MILVHVKSLKFTDLRKFLFLEVLPTLGLNSILWALLLKLMFLEVLPTLGLNSILWDCFGILEHRSHQVPR